MALVKCPECDKDVSDEAKACPYCGRPLQPASAKKSAHAARAGCLAILGLFGIFILVGVLLDSLSPSPKQKVCTAGYYHGVLMKDPYEFAMLFHGGESMGNAEDDVICTHWGYEADSQEPERTCLEGYYNGVFMQDPYVAEVMALLRGEKVEPNAVRCTKWAPSNSSAAAVPSTATPASKAFPNREAYCRNWVKNFRGATTATNDQLYDECMNRNDLEGEPPR